MTLAAGLDWAILPSSISGEFVPYLLHVEATGNTRNMCCAGPNACRAADCFLEAGRGTSDWPSEAQSGRLSSECIGSRIWQSRFLAGFTGKIGEFAPSAHTEFALFRLQQALSKG
jgi:hypothetical protein